MSARGQLTLADVQQVIAQASSRAQIISPNSVIAVTDREGYVLGVWSVNGATNSSPAFDDLIANAIVRAGTAAFLSSDQHAFSARTAGFIVQQNFPPGVKNRGPGPLVGVNFSNLSFSDVNHFKDPHTFDPFAFGGGGTNGAPITPIEFSAISGLAGSPGGVPLYDTAGHLIGGVGAAITGNAPIPELYDIQQSAKQHYDIDEDVAVAGQIGFEPNRKFFGS